MRVIEEMMLNAVKAKGSFKCTNTQVITNNYGTFVRLYNTIIFASVKGKIYYSDGGYNTATTASRLRALGACYSTNTRLRKCKITDQVIMLNLYYSGKVKA